MRYCIVVFTSRHMIVATETCLARPGPSPQPKSHIYNCNNVQLRRRRWGPSVESITNGTAVLCPAHRCV